MAAERNHGRGDPLELESESESDDDGITVPSLQPVPPGLAKPNDSLCDTCTALDLTPTRFIILPGDIEAEIPVETPDELSIQLGFVDDIRRKSHCPFCRLVLRALGPGLPSFEDGERVSVVMSWNTDGPNPTGLNRIPQIRVLRPFAVKEDNAPVRAKGLNVSPEITLVANDAPTPSKSFFVRFIKDQIDFEMVSNWLAICRIKHGIKCNRSAMLEQQSGGATTDIPHFRLIDVVDNCIRPAPSGCKYVALSYVWGLSDPTAILRTLKSNVNQLEIPGALLLPTNLDRIPRTIRDAMQVVRELDMHYLWVDSLCIVQDDDVNPGGSKIASISKMDLVYGRAYLTIIAATGIDSNAGLPGLHPNTRGVNQPIEEVLPGLRLAFKQKSVDYSEKSVYYTRAWTFQEQTFMNRSLTFIGGQVVFNCQCISENEWREDVVFEDQRNRAGEIDIEDEDDIAQYEALIQEYSALSLTYESDIYHAFAGITRYFNMRLKVNLCHGIPDAYFDWFLLWISLVPQKRRERNPSWSWSGWIGESWPCMWSWYSRSIPRIRKALRQRTWIIWYQRKAHDSEECVRVWTPKTSSSASSGPRNFYGSHAGNRFPFVCSHTEPTRRKLIGAPEYIEDTHNPTSGSGFLQFWTVSVVFKLDKARSVENARGELNSRSRLGIFGCNGRELGIVFVNPEWAEVNISKNHEFILLCEGRDLRDNGETEKPEWKYKVMLIEWHGDWAERISVGSIRKGDLKQARGNGPVWKEIILG
ncbi:heterokaryon incompatibility protein-domain-containing protein [Flammula alnicola]|nr:heterokaryon incompatibility protein-domain-containing protein [Flammula alnicola]